MVVTNHWVFLFALSLSNSPREVQIYCSVHLILVLRSASSSVPFTHSHFFSNGKRLSRNIMVHPMVPHLLLSRLAISILRCVVVHSFTALQCVYRTFERRLWVDFESCTTALYMHREHDRHEGYMWRRLKFLRIIFSYFANTTNQGVHLFVPMNILLLCIILLLSLLCIILPMSTASSQLWSVLSNIFQIEHFSRICTTKCALDSNERGTQQWQSALWVRTWWICTRSVVLYLQYFGGSCLVLDSIYRWDE